MLGHTEVKVGLRSGMYKATVVVSVRMERPNFIIGANILAAHNCYLSLSQKLFTIREQKIQCIPEGIRANRTKLKAARRIQLPPQSKVLVSCKATKSIKYFGTPHAVVQSPDNCCWYAKDSLVIRLSLTAPDSGTDYLPVMTLLDVPHT